MTIRELREKKGAAWEKAKKLNDLATKESRNLNSEEEKEWVTLNKEIDDCNKQIERMERAAEIEREQAVIAQEAMELQGKSADEFYAEKASDQELRNIGFSAWIKTRNGTKLTDKEVAAGQKLGVDFLSKEYEFALVRKIDSVFNSRHIGSGFQIEERAQATSPDSAGGSLIPEGFVRELEKALLFFGPMLQIARVLRTNEGNDLPWPTVDDTSNTGSDIAENAAAAEQDVTFGEIVLKAFKITSDLVKVSMELMEDSFEDMGAIMGELLGERLGRRINNKTTVGVGTTEPFGWTLEASVGTTAASPTVITSDELLDFQHSVDVAYRNDAVFMFNDSTTLFIRKIKDLDDNYIWRPGLREGVPDVLLGSRYAINNDVASIAANNIVGGYGQWQKFVIRMVRTIRLRRLDELFAVNDQVGFIGFARLDSRLIDAGTGPIKTFKMGA